MRDKRDVMRLHIKNGIRNLDGIRESYNTYADGGKPIMMQPSPDNFSLAPERYTTRATNSELTPKEFTEKYISSDIYRKRLSRQGYENPSSEVLKRLSSVEETNTIYQAGTPSLKTQLFNELKNIPYSLTGSNASAGKHVIIDTEQAKKLKVPVSSIETHEYSHKETGIDKDRLNNNDIMELQWRLRPEIRDEHDIDPTENKADLNVLRYELYKSGVDVFNSNINKKHLDIIRNMKESGGKRVLKHYKDEDVIWLLNNIARNDELPDNFLNDNIT